MKKSGAMFFKNLRYICLVGVIALGLMTIVGSNGGDESTTSDGTTVDGTTGDGSIGDGTTTTAATATSFNISAAKALLAQEETVSATSVRKTSSDGRSLFTYKIVNQGLERPLTREESLERAKSRSALADGDETGTNLLAVDEEGNTWPAIVSDYFIKVMYCVTDPTGEYVYLALDTGWWNWDSNDYTKFIGQENCAFFRIKIADDTCECVKEGIFVQNMDQNYMKAISGSQKPIQFDDDGNLFFTATEFTRNVDSWENCWWDPAIQEDVCETQYSYWIDSTTWKPRIYRMDKDTSEITAITQDIESVNYFLALPSGEVAYQSWNEQTWNAELSMWQDGATIDLSTSGGWGVDFFTVDTDRAVMWGEWGVRGISFARPRVQQAGVEKATLETNLFGGNSWGDSTPRRVIVADDGRLYGIFESYLWDNDAQEGYVVLSVYQILPYDGVPKVEFTLSDTWGWWDWMGETPFQISKGFLYYVENYDPADGLGTIDIIKMVKLQDRTTSQILDTGSGRYDIYSWRLSGDTLYFSALDKSRTVVVSGEIDTAKVKLGLGVVDFLSIIDTASAEGAVSKIQDIELLTPQEPAVDTGGTPVVQQWHTSPENLYSVSMDFTKYMSKQSIEDNLTFVDGASNAIESMKVWIYKALHLIPDLDATGLLDSSGTTPLANDTTYTITLGDDTMDAYGHPLGDADGTLPKYVEFDTKPTYGWWHSTTDTTVTVISSGGVAKYAGPATDWTKETYDLGLDIPAPANVRIEFSAKNYGWEGVNVVLWNKTEYTSSSNNWNATVAQYRLGNWSNLEYKKLTYTEWKDGNTPKLFNGSWMRYRIDIYGGNMKLHYWENETDGWVEVESLSVTDLISRADNYTFLLRIVEPAVMDNLKISTLDSLGACASEGNILGLDFTANIEVAVGDVALDNIGFDSEDDLNSDLGFGSW